MTIKSACGVLIRPIFVIFVVIQNQSCWDARFLSELQV